MYSVWLAGAANGARLRRWIRAKKGDWYAVLEAPRMAVTSTLLDQAHNVIDRKLLWYGHLAPRSKLN